MSTLVEKLPQLVDIHKLNRWLPTLIIVILVIATSYTLSRLTWLLAPGGDQQAIQAPDQPVSPRQANGAQPMQLVSRITDAHLFGVYQSTASEPARTDAPETRLNLTLKGVLSATPATNASAIIATGKNGPEDIYSVGDKVSSATVKEIHADRVILERNGRYETLRLPIEFSDNTLIETVDDNEGPDLSSASSPGEVLSGIRREILRNPTAFGKYAIPIPYNDDNGQLRGYRLQPQGDTTLFDQLGLTPDDVILAINGEDLNDPARGLAALRKLQRAKQIDLKVLRNGAEIPLHFEMP